jgi:hypothetical protein
MNSLVAYLVAAMNAWVPVQTHAALFGERPEDVAARYESIARDAAEVAFDEAEAPIYEGPEGRARTAVLMLSVASYESFFRKSVDEGSERGDHGRSYCVMQIFMPKGRTREGWSTRNLIEDRKLCFRAGLHIMQNSMSDCRRMPFDDRLSAYVTGQCFFNMSLSRQRFGRARAWWASHALPDATSQS